MSDNEVDAGQAVYNPIVLRAYDFIVLDVSCSLIWRCPKRRMRELYDQHLGTAHVDVGVGSGYFLDKARWPIDRPRVALVDLNPNSLRYTAERVKRFAVSTHKANALEPLPLPAGQFGSGAANFLLHCVPGDLAAKAVVLDHLAACVMPGGKIFGSTILAEGVQKSKLATGLMAKYNARGIFHNERDSLETLKDQLGKRFDTYDLAVEGTVALFAATVPDR